MSERLRDLNSTLKANRFSKIPAIIGIIICGLLVARNAINGEWDLAGAYFVAFMFSVSNYAAIKSAESNVKTALALHHENTQ